MLKINFYELILSYLTCFIFLKIGFCLFASFPQHNTFINYLKISYNDSNDTCFPILPGPPSHPCTPCPQKSPKTPSSICVPIRSLELDQTPSDQPYPVNRVFPPSLCQKPSAVTLQHLHHSLQGLSSIASV